MNNDQQQNDNQNNSGISGFGNPGEIVPEQQTNQNNNVPVPPMENEPTAPKTENMGMSPEASNDNAPIAPLPPEVGSNSFAGLNTKQNYAKQTVVGGVEEPQPKMKNIFTPSQTDNIPGASSVPPVQGENQNPAQQSPVYNEITASGSKNNFALIAIVVGVVLLLIAGGGYYYYMVLNQTPEPVVEDPIIEEPIDEIVSENPIDQDPYMMSFDQLDANASTDLTELESQIQTLDFSGIDNELIIPAMDAVPEENVVPSEPDLFSPTQP